MGDEHTTCWDCLLEHMYASTVESNFALESLRGHPTAACRQNGVLTARDKK